MGDSNRRSQDADNEASSQNSEDDNYRPSEQLSGEPRNKGLLRAYFMIGGIGLPSLLYLFLAPVTRREVSFWLNMIITSILGLILGLVLLKLLIANIRKKKG
jgi:hypothetical protein